MGNISPEWKVGKMSDTNEVISEAYDMGLSHGMQRALDRFKEHQTKAARAGGRVRSAAKAAAARANLAKAREKRHRHEGTLASPESQEPSNVEVCEDSQTSS